MLLMLKINQTFILAALQNTIVSLFGSSQFSVDSFQFVTLAMFPATYFIHFFIFEYHIKKCCMDMPRYNNDNHIQS